MTPADFRLEPEGNGDPAGRDMPATTPALEREVVVSSLGAVRRGLYLLGAALCALFAWWAFRPDGGALAERWWWDVLVPTAGEAYWNHDRAMAGVVGLLAASCLVAALLPPGRVRAGVALAAASVGFAAFYRARDWLMPEDVAAIWAAFALVVGGTTAVGARLSRHGGRVVLAVGLAVLAVQLALPLPSAELSDLTDLPAREEKAAVVAWVDAVVHPADGAGALDAFREPGARLMALLVAACALGLLALFGVAARWLAWAALGLGVVGAAMFPVEAALGGTGLAPLAVLVLPIVAGVLDALASGRERRSLGV